jgi:hypothetical protein
MAMYTKSVHSGDLLVSMYTDASKAYKRFTSRRLQGTSSREFFTGNFSLLIIP